MRRDGHVARHRPPRAAHHRLLRLGRRRRPVGYGRLPPRRELQTRGGEPTPFGDALFEALATASTMPGAFAEAQKRLAAEGPSPVIHVGKAIGTQLARLRGAGGGRAALTGIPRG